MISNETRLNHPPLEGEGRTAEGSPGWGDSGAARAEALPPPPGPLARADLPPPGGGNEAPGGATMPRIAAIGNARYFPFRILVSNGFLHLHRILPVVAALGAALAFPPLTGAQPLTNPSYTREQAAQGKAAYPLQCATCHGANLDDGEFAPPLKGVAFRQQWGRQSVEAIFTYIGTRMPPARPRSLGDPTTAAPLP